MLCPSPLHSDVRAASHLHRASAAGQEYVAAERKRVEVDTIFETKLKLTTISLLSAETKRRIMQGAAPEEQEKWRTRMHITAGAAEAEARGEKPRKPRVRKR